jgi:uncharacterized protein
MKRKFTKRSLINTSVEELFNWHRRPDAFERLAPPWMTVEILDRTDGIDDGARITLLIHAGRMKIKWKLEHTCYIENKQFCDFQTEGPLRSWYHTHLFEPAGDGKTWMEDRVEYELPYGMIGMFMRPIIDTELKRLFDHRHQVLQQEFP